jgi:hypothetical protein
VWEARRAHLDEAGVRPPAVDHAPLDAVQRPTHAFPVELIEGAARRRARVLRILCKCDGTRDAVRAHLGGGLVCQRARVAERDISFMWRRRGVQLVEQCSHALALKLGPLADRGAAPDRLVLLLDLRRAALRDDGCKQGLKRQRYEVAVKEEVLEEVVCFGDLRVP